MIKSFIEKVLQLKYEANDKHKEMPTIVYLGNREQSMLQSEIETKTEQSLGLKERNDQLYKAARRGEYSEILKMFIVTVNLPTYLHFSFGRAYMFEGDLPPHQEERKLANETRNYNIDFVELLPEDDRNSRLVDSVNKDFKDHQEKMMDLINLPEGGRGGGKSALVGRAVEKFVEEYVVFPRRTKE